jgi:hypothetical protein
MSAYEINRNNTTRHCVFALDDESDLAMLPTSKKSGTGDLKLSTPCRQGSVARTTAGKRYVLSGKDEWDISSSDNGGGGSNDEDVEPISTSTIESLFE